MGDQRERERLSEEPNQAERVRVSEAVNWHLCQEHGPRSFCFCDGFHT
jgi:hypothetical protein